MLVQFFPFFPFSKVVILSRTQLRPVYNKYYSDQFHLCFLLSSLHLCFMLPILFLHTLFLLCPSTLSQSLLPPHFFLRVSSLSSSLPSFASTLSFFSPWFVLLFEEQSADGERRCFVRRVSAPGCATAVDSRESRGMSWRL